MPKQRNNQPEDEAARAEKRAQIKRRIWRRFIGAGVVFSLAFVLWWVGDDVPSRPVFQTVAETPEVPADFFTSPEAAESTDGAVPMDSADETASVTSPTGTPEVTEIEAVETPTAATPAITTDEVDERDESESAGIAETTEAEESNENNESNETAAAAPSALRWQAGAFGKLENAERFVEQLRQHGFDGRISLIDGLHKVHIVNLRDKAHLTRAKAIVDDLLAGKPAAAGTADAPTTQEAGEPSAFAVQVGAFRERKYAEAIVEKLTAAGYAMVLQPAIRNDVEMLRVRAVNLHDRASAEAARRAIIKLGYDSATVIDLR